jgi:hypothetical protein
MKMKHTEILTSAAGNLKSREDQFGPEERAFDNAAQIASIMLGKPITPHDVTTILLCVDLGRIPQSRTNNVNYVNLINNAAYVGQYSRSEATVMSSLTDDITSMAAKLAPVMPRVEPFNPPAE